VLVSSGSDREVHRIVAGQGEYSSAYVAEKRFADTDVNSGGSAGSTPPTGGTPRQISLDNSYDKPPPLKPDNYGVVSAELAMPHAEDVGIGDGITQVVVSSDRRLLVVSIGSKTLVYSFNDIVLKGDFRLLSSLQGHEDTVTCLCMNSAVSSAPPTLFSGSKDNTVRMWDLSRVAPEVTGTVSVDSKILGPMAASITQVCVDRLEGSLLFVGLARINSGF